MRSIGNNCLFLAIEKYIFGMKQKDYREESVPGGASANSSMQFTPEHITSLAPGEVFVFGSNLAGMHGGGAARVAMQRLGAVWGQGVGLQGQSYAIPTMQGGVETIEPYVDEFIAFAREHRELRFYVTRIGCGIAGFQDREIAPLFAKALGVENIVLPKSFVDVLQSK